MNIEKTKKWYRSLVDSALIYDKKVCQQRIEDNHTHIKIIDEVIEERKKDGNS